MRGILMRTRFIHGTELFPGLCCNLNSTIHQKKTALHYVPSSSLLRYKQLLKPSRLLSGIPYSKHHSSMYLNRDRNALTQFKLTYVYIRQLNPSAAENSKKREISMSFRQRGFWDEICKSSLLMQSLDFFVM
ncbi:hypothetical protein HNY73_009019 [Argiope bruennichi]|uniref:Uncharacterized protein n=1 Tax=Argiope bruennichi TaxID=94029 RepID=A0A8T0FAX2_ARGBR|nr:hypothetical protein HNY73_009019 [Argiope bruennichi]